MMLGIILHAAAIYTVGSHWLIADAESSPVFSWLAASIHVFRMPAFFLISGYFCARALSHKPAFAVIQDRLLRLLLPALMTWLCLNSLQYFFLNGSFRIADLVQGLIPLYHLWFLIDLAIFSLAWIGLQALLRRLPRMAIRWPGPNGAVALLLGLTLFSYSALLLIRLLPHAYDSLYGLTTPYRLAGAIPFFVAGTHFLRQPQLYLDFLKLPFPATLLAIPLAAFIHDSPSAGPAWQRELLLAAEMLAIWLSVGAVLQTFRTLFKQRSRAIDWMSDASYTIFLSHHLWWS